MNFKKNIFKAIAFALVCVSCNSGGQPKNDVPLAQPQTVDPVTIIEPEPENTEKNYNFKFTGFDINIDDPKMDKRSYYKVYIDKIDIGRTTIGLESQQKYFEEKLPANRHLLIVEKWALDEKKGKYIKLNNIDQPKPDFIYFDLEEGKTVNIIMKYDPVANAAEYSIESEK